MQSQVDQQLQSLIAARDQAISDHEAAHDAAEASPTQANVDAAIATETALENAENALVLYEQSVGLTPKEGAHWDPHYDNYFTVFPTRRWTTYEGPTPIIRLLTQDSGYDAGGHHEAVIEDTDEYTMLYVTRQAASQTVSTNVGVVRFALEQGGRAILHMIGGGGGGSHGAGGGGGAGCYVTADTTIEAFHYFSVRVGHGGLGSVAPDGDWSATAAQEGSCTNGGTTEFNKAFFADISATGGQAPSTDNSVDGTGCGAGGDHYQHLDGSGGPASAAPANFNTLISSVDVTTYTQPGGDAGTAPGSAGGGGGGISSTATGPGGSSTSHAGAGGDGINVYDSYVWGCGGGGGANGAGYSTFGRGGIMEGDTESFPTSYGGSGGDYTGTTGQAGGDAVANTGSGGGGGGAGSGSLTFSKPGNGGNGSAGAFILKVFK